MIQFKTFLEEGMRPLTPAEWDKPNSQTNEPRLTILKRLIQQKADIVTVDNDTIKLADDERNYGSIKDFEDNPGKAFTLYKTNGDTISSSKIAKSPVFGGGKGSGGGTENTAYAETQQCYYLAAMLKNPNKPIEFYTPEVLEKTRGRASTGKTTLEQTFEELDASWGVSAYLSGQILIKQGYVNRKHTFHRDSPEMQYIYKAKDTAFKNSGFSKMKDDKWNPGDIWAIEDGLDLKKELNITSVSALNLSIKKLLDSRKLVPISLKKVKKKAKIVTQTPARADSPAYTLSKINLQSDRGTFWTNKMATIIFKPDGKMDIRANAPLSASKFEIVQKAARAGGAGWTIFMDFAKRYMNETVPPYTSIKAQGLKMAKGDKKEIGLFKKYAVKVDRSAEKNFEAELAKKDKIWIVAKYAATFASYLLITNRGPKADKVINAMVNYAASTSEDACIHIVVKEG